MTTTDTITLDVQTAREWQPIETAPKNPAGEFYGPYILIFCTADGMPWPACWSQGGPDNKGCWMVFDGVAPSDEIWPDDATHWMPLPKPAFSKLREKLK